MTAITFDSQPICAERVPARKTTACCSEQNHHGFEKGSVLHVVSGWLPHSRPTTAPTRENSGPAGSGERFPTRPDHLPSKHLPAFQDADSLDSYLEARLEEAIEHFQVRCRTHHRPSKGPQNRPSRRKTPQKRVAYRVPPFLRQLSSRLLSWFRSLSESPGQVNRGTSQKEVSA